MELPHISEQPMLTGATALYPWSEKMASKLLVRSHFDEELLLYERVGEKMRLPRAMCPMGKVDKRVVGIPVSFDIDPPTPRDEEQARCWDEALQLLRQKESFVYESPTGTGKTVAGCAMIHAIGRKALVIVPKTDLMHGKDQWVDAFKQFLGLKSSEIGFIQGDRCEVEGKKVVLGMLKSLSIKGRYPRALLAQFGFVIWDEVHRLPATTFSKTGGLFPALLRMGLSATPQRLDGKDILIEANIGPVMVRSDSIPMTPLVATYNSGWKNPRDNRGRKIRGEAGKMGHVLTMLAGSHKRNKFITHFVVDAYKKGRRVLVFSDRVRHLEELRSMAATLGVPMQDTALYVSKAKKAELDAAGSKKVIFATYGMMGEGTNIPWLDCCILATPRANVKQFIGRVLRVFLDKLQPIIIDILDNDNPHFKSFGKKRRLLYVELGADFFQRKG